MNARPPRSALLSAFLIGLAAPAAAIELLPHRAAYRVSLAETSRGPVTEVKGGLVLEWRAECDGWISNQRLGFVAAMGEGPGFSYDVRFTSWESRDNTRLRFSVKSFDDGKPAEEYRGQAALEGPGRAGLALFALPEESRMELPVGTIFPTEHVVRLIEAALRGERVVTHTVFDGSGKDALSTVNAVIGAPRGGEEPRWPVRLAYFGAGKNDATPDFTIAFELDRRGVLYDITLDYGEFVLKGRLDRLEPLPSPECR
ncbi:MAG: cell envelope integrity EipB family protein [Geminicoccaceae bacterium]|nr:cell envelope integrity EipB family protein [Geminicoccaceae bacterium]